MKEFFEKFKAQIIKGALAFIGLLGAVFFFTKYRNNSTLRTNEEANREVSKLDGKLELTEEAIKKEDEAISAIKEEVKNETSSEKTTKELADFFSNFLNRK